MGVDSNQCRLLLLTARRDDLEYSMNILSMRQQLLATNRANATAQKAAAMSAYLQTPDQPVEFEHTAAYMEYEREMLQLNAADSELDRQIKAMETEHQAVTQEIEETRKLVDTNVKNSFGIFK